MARPAGWRKEPARHALAAKGVKTTTARKPTMPGLVENTPHRIRDTSKLTDEDLRELAQSYELHIALDVPPTVQSDKQLMAFFKKRYGLYLDLTGDTEEERDENDTYEHIFYNADLRSQCGMYMGEDHIVLWPHYWAGSDEHDGSYRFDTKEYYGSMFKRMIKDAERVNVARDKNGDYTEEGMF